MERVKERVWKRQKGGREGGREGEREIDRRGWLGEGGKNQREKKLKLVRALTKLNPTKACQCTN